MPMDNAYLFACRRANMRKNHAMRCTYLISFRSIEQLTCNAGRIARQHVKFGSLATEQQLHTAAEHTLAL